jgi:hypothetical protein
MHRPKIDHATTVRLTPFAPFGPDVIEDERYRDLSYSPPNDDHAEYENVFSFSLWRRGDDRVQRTTWID